MSRKRAENVAICVGPAPSVTQPLPPDPANVSGALPVQPTSCRQASAPCRRVAATVTGSRAARAISSARAIRLASGSAWFSRTARMSQLTLAVLVTVSVTPAPRATRTLRPSSAISGLPSRRCQTKAGRPSIRLTAATVCLRRASGSAVSGSTAHLTRYAS
jgi:hypothetical protein